jgi:hypothetical protein
LKAGSGRDKLFPMPRVIITLTILALVSGCSRGTDSPKEAADIRGQPISSVVTNRTTATGEVAKAAAAPGYLDVGFEKLSGYAFEVSDDLLAPTTNSPAATAKVEAQIPKTVKELDQKPVALTGFMLPLRVEGGLVTEMLIMKDQSMCCYGVQPKINEWVSVRMVKNGVKPVMDQPVKLYGKLRVGEMRENGYLVGIYALDGERMQAPEL